MGHHRSRALYISYNVIICRESTVMNTIIILQKKASIYNISYLTISCLH